MDMTSPGLPPPAGNVRRGLVPAGFVLGGALLSLAGLSWDMQWHNDVGPDTFFTMPHLFLYTGSAVAGFASLAVVLSATAAQRRGQPVDPVVGGRAVGVFGRTFTAPAGYLISGIGAAGFLLYGLWDEWWHGLYGFDVTVASPPHVGFLLSVQITMVGALVVFMAARQHRWGVIGTIVSAATLMAFSIVTVMGLDALSIDEFDAVGAGVVFICVVVVMMCAHALDRPIGAIGVVAAVAAMQAVLWWFSPWATVIYADAIGLPMRDYIDGVPVHAASIPMVLILIGVLMGVLRRPAWLIGAISGTVLATCAPLQQAWLYDSAMPELPTVLLMAAVGTVVGALAGFLGARFGELLEQQSASKETRHA
jgi:hypothetical protein